MNVIQIIFKLRNLERDYFSFYEYIESLNSKHVLDYVYWIKTDLNISDIITEIKKHVEDTDLFYVTELNVNNIDGWMATSFWKWLK